MTTEIEELRMPENGKREEVRETPAPIPFAPPSVGEEEIEALVAAVRSGWLSRGPQVAEFEEEFARAVDAPAALAVNSCTSALHLGLIAAGVQPGDEVILSTVTFCSAANVVLQLGATPVLVDISPGTLNLDVERVKAAIGPKTAAIMPVHLAGLASDTAELDRLAEAHELAVVEDAAHALPTRYPDGVPVGSGGRFAAFSFYATKNLTTGEGGMLTGPVDAVERVRSLSLHGMSRDSWSRYGSGGSWHYTVGCPGFKYNMTDPAAAMGRVQLTKLESMHRRRREVAARYDAAFREIPGVVLPPRLDPEHHGWHLYPLQLPEDPSGRRRNDFIEGMKARGISCSVHFIPLHTQPAYAWLPSVESGAFPAAEAYYSRCVSLPIHPFLTEAEVLRIVDAATTLIDPSPAPA